MDIKERIAGLLQEQGKNMTQLADHCGVSPQAVQQWIAKGRMPRPDRLKQIAEFFGITPGDLFVPGSAPREEAQDDLGAAVDILTLYQRVPAPLRPKVYKALRGLIIEIAGIEESSTDAAANDKT